MPFHNTSPEYDQPQHQDGEDTIVCHIPRSKARELMLLHEAYAYALREGAGPVTALQKMRDLPHATVNQFFTELKDLL